MAPQGWPPKPFGPLSALLGRRNAPLDAKCDAREAGGAPCPDALGNCGRVANLRRLSLLLLMLLQTAAATWFLLGVMPYHGRHPMEIANAALFAILFCWISGGFWTAVMGFWVLRFGKDRYSISATAAGPGPIDPEARTAIVMPICNEDAAKVFARLGAIYASVKREGQLALFDFFVLSDTSDPDIRVAEMNAWSQLCSDQAAYGRVFYRWRRHRIKRKSGNIADFCRRWGKKYRYMTVLDADSIMSGACLARLVRLMEANPNAGIMQTTPQPVGRVTLYARIQQFAARAYGPLFIAGLHFWQLGESNYWGHNAIIRVAPFVRHCALGRLPGRGPLSGEILSHDFVEAALMRRAGWGVWMVYDLQGSYEEVPPNLADELKRDRRWCQGNLINSRLFLAQGMHPAHRAVFMSGAFTYVSAPLWFLLLMLSTAMLAIDKYSAPFPFLGPHELSPIGAQGPAERAVVLFIVTAMLLFLPKILAIALILAKETRGFGGRARVIASMLAEMVFSTLLAPIRMLFHSRFVAAGLTGVPVQWKSPAREDAETGWRDAVRLHGMHTLLGVAWAAWAYRIDPSFLVWLLPVVGALILSIPLSVLSSRASIGRAMRARRWFLIPEESQPPAEVLQAERSARQLRPSPGFAEAVVDPKLNALLCACASPRSNASGAVRKRRQTLISAALAKGPGLPSRQKMFLLEDPIALATLHSALGRRPDLAAA